jgi:hypothetical protein
LRTLPASQQTPAQQVGARSASMHMCQLQCSTTGGGAQCFNAHVPATVQHASTKTCALHSDCKWMLQQCRVPTMVWHPILTPEGRDAKHHVICCAWWADVDNT